MPTIAEQAEEYLKHFTPTTKQRQQFSKAGVAMPDGSFYIRNASDLSNAIGSVGRATPNASESEVARRNSVRRHVMARARALKLSHMIPNTWNSDGSLKQSAMLEEFLAHFGVRGMKWGVRRARSSRPHVSSPEAAKAMQLQTKARSSGTHTLTNAELQALVGRMNLETQYSNLNQRQVNKGRKIATDILVEVGKQEAKQLIMKGAEKGAAELIKRLVKK